MFDDTYTKAKLVVKPSRSSGSLLRRVVLALSVLAVGFVLIVSVRWIVLVAVRHRTAAIVAKLDRDEPGWRLEQIEAARKVVPAEVNSAIPIIKANRLVPARWLELVAQTPLAGTSAKPNEAPQLRAIQDRAAALLKGAARDDPRHRIVPLIEKDDFPAPDDQQIAALRAELAALAPALAELQKVNERPEGRYPLVLQRNLLKTFLPHAQEARNPARILKLVAILKIHDGDLEGALASSRGILNVGRSLGDEPFLTTQLFRIAVGSVALRSIERVLAGGEVSDASLAKIQSLLEDEEAQPTFLWGIRGERAVFNEFFARLAAREIQLDDQKMTGWVHWFAGESMYTYGQGLALDVMSSAVAIPGAKLSQQKALAQAWLKDLAKRYASGDWDREICRHLPEITWFVNCYVVAKARLRTAIVAIAAERYRLKNGRWPRKLDELTPWPLARVPDDPHTDRPLLMMRLDKDQTLVIYATGPDLVDNAGNLEQRPRIVPQKPSNRITTIPAWEGQDIGFRLKDAATRRAVKSPG